MCREKNERALRKAIEGLLRIRAAAGPNDDVSEIDYRLRQLEAAEASNRRGDQDGYLWSLIKAMEGSTATGST